MEDFRQNSQNHRAAERERRSLEAAVETLSNLIYVAARDVDQPEQVRVYLEHAQKQVDSIVEALKKDAARTAHLN